jgi:hypothetical protein
MQLTPFSVYHIIKETKSKKKAWLSSALCAYMVPPECAFPAPNGHCAEGSAFAVRTGILQNGRYGINASV